MNLYLIRHGETDWNAEGRLQGQTDISLNEKGMGQMRQVAEKMKQLRIGADLIVTSPLLRARQSADIVSAILGYNMEDILVEPLLIERSFGEGEGKVWSELVVQYPKGICRGYETFGGDKVSFSQGSIYVVKCLEETIEIAGCQKEKEQFLCIERFREVVEKMNI